MPVIQDKAYAWLTVGVYSLVGPIVGMVTLFLIIGIADWHRDTQPPSQFRDIVDAAVNNPVQFLIGAYVLGGPFALLTGAICAILEYRFAVFSWIASAMAAFVSFGLIMILGRFAALGFEAFPFRLFEAVDLWLLAICIVAGVSCHRLMQAAKRLS
jgi:hypothetical protein